MIEGRYFITPHAVRRFRERIAPLPFEAARQAIIDGLAQCAMEPKPLKSGRGVMIRVRGRRQGGFDFRAVVVGGKDLPAVSCILRSGRSGRRWTPEEIQLAADRRSSWTVERIAEELGRTPGSVRSKISAGGLHPRLGEYVDTREAAKITGYSRWNLRHLRRLGRIPGKRLPGTRRWLYKADAIAKLAPVPGRGYIPPPDGYLTPAQASEACGFSSNWLRRLAGRGAIRCLRIKHCYFFRPEDLPRWVSARQAARILRVSLRTVQRWCADGKVKAKMKMGQYLIRRSALPPRRGVLPVCSSCHAKEHQGGKDQD